MNKKIILPLLLISALLILLTGCMTTPTDESPGVTGTGTIIGTISAPCCSTSIAPVSDYPEYWCFYCQQDWMLQDGIKVVLTYGEDEVATTYTNEDGEYIFTDVLPGSNYVVTAYCPDYNDNRPLVKDVALEVASTFDTEVTDLVSTSLGLVVDFLVLYTEWGPEDISLDAVIADQTAFSNFPKFKALIYEVRRVIENCEINLATDEEVLYATCRAAEEISGLDIGCGPGYTPTNGPTDPCATNSPPYDVFLDDPNPSVVAGCAYTGTVTAKDDNVGDTLTYSLTVGIGDMEINSGTGVITWNPTCDDICYCTDQLVDMGRKSKPNNGCTPNIIEVTVSDGCESVDAEFCIAVTNQAPVIDDIDGESDWNSCENRYEASAIATCDATYQVTAHDPDDCQTVLLYSLENAAPGMTIDSSGLITWNPVPCPNGPRDVTVKVMDACDAEDTVTLRATSTNVAPTIDPIGAMSVPAGCCLDPTVSAVGHDADIDAGCSQTLTYSFDGTSNTPPNMNIDSVTGEITWCPSCEEEEHGVYAVVVKVEDNCGPSAITSFTATATNAAPVIDSITNTNSLIDPPTSDYWTSEIATCSDTYQVMAHDPDACQNVLLYSLENAAPGMTINSSGLITWNPVPCP
ncbi:MAG: carboxypeptidase regulatory-like domain-containing protein, partial [Candidatus Atribacteria bacterium]|nr:carboxypeptidase regulatory-like domain-containing protein [Candidatus Atribacteria bacterium]